MIFEMWLLNHGRDAGSLLIHSSLVSTAIFHLVGGSIIGKSFEIIKT